MTRKPSVVYVFASVNDLSSEILGIIYKSFFCWVASNKFYIWKDNIHIQME